MLGGKEGVGEVFIEEFRGEVGEEGGGDGEEEGVG